jgi:hypothetical protein
MKNSLIFIIILFCSVIFQTTVINSFFYPIFLIPFVLIIGTLIYHFLPAFYGFSWFILLPIFLYTFTNIRIPIITYPIIAVIGYLMILRIFTRHSFLGLVGLGISLYFIQILIFMICNYEWHVNYPILRSLILSTFISIVMLFAGYAIMQKITTKKRIYIVNLHDRI